MWMFEPDKLLERRRRRKGPAPTGWSVRPAGADDEPFLREMSYGAAFWRDGQERPSFDEALADPMLRRYVEGWGRGGDAGFIAEEQGGARIGACWIRLFAPDAPGYGFVDASVPELSIYVVPERRGGGIGGRLIQTALEHATREAVPAVSLSVAADNPAIRLYERHGFVQVGFDGHSYTMRADLY